MKTKLNTYLIRFRGKGKHLPFSDMAEGVTLEDALRKLGMTIWDVESWEYLPS